MQCLYVSLFTVLIALSSVTIPARSAVPQNTDLCSYQSLRPLSGQAAFFTENQGQWDEHVLFKADGAGGLTWWIERDGFTVLYSVPDSQLDSQQMKRMGYEADPFDDLSASSASSAEKYLSHSLKFKFQHTISVNRFVPDRSSPTCGQRVNNFEPDPANSSEAVHYHINNHI